MTSLLLPMGKAAAQPKVEAPLILTNRQFACLRASADQLKIGKRGSIVDYGTCPPGVEDAFYPATPSQTKRLMTPADMDCLVKARTRGSGIAFQRSGGRVTVYLHPCGRR